MRRLCVFPSLSHSFFTLLLCLIRFAKDLVYVFMYVSCECVCVYGCTYVRFFVCTYSLARKCLFEAWDDMKRTIVMIMDDHYDNNNDEIEK